MIPFHIIMFDFPILNCIIITLSQLSNLVMFTQESYILSLFSSVFEFMNILKIYDAED